MYRQNDVYIKGNVLTLKPLSFTVEKLELHNNLLRIQAKVIDVETQEPLTLNHVEVLDEIRVEYMSTELLSLFIRDQLLNMIKHELNECLFLNGKHVTTPEHTLF